MNRTWADVNYSSSPIKSDAEGWIGLELHRVRGPAREPVVRVVYWDAMGQFFIETLGTDVPVEVVEELIAEAKATIPTR